MQELNAKGKFVLLQKKVKKEQGGVIMPTTKSAERVGVIVSKGGDVPSEFKIGDITKHKEYIDGESFEKGGVNYTILMYSDILLTYKDKK